MADGVIVYLVDQATSGCSSENGGTVIAAAQA